MAWILSLPDTVQEQLNEAIDHGFDGMIVYVDEAGKPLIITSELYKSINRIGKKRKILDND